MPKPDDLGFGIAVFVLRLDGLVLVLKRKGAHRQVWSLPGGWMERTDTSFLAACRREVREEVCLEINDMEFLCATTEDHPEIEIRSVTHWYVACEDQHWSPDQEPAIGEPEKVEALGWNPPWWLLGRETFPNMDVGVEALVDWAERELVTLDEYDNLMRGLGR